MDQKTQVAPFLADKASMKSGKTIHDIFVFYTPRLISIYFDFLKSKARKAVGITSLLVMGDEVPNLFSESHMLDPNLPPIFPKVKDIKNEAEFEVSKEATTDASKNVVDLCVERKLKNFGKNQKKSQSNRSCIIDKKAS